MELKDCPFCATADQIEIEDVTTETYAVWCRNCGALGPLAISKDGAIECWNSRGREVVSGQWSVDRKSFSLATDDRQLGTDLR